MKPTKKRRILQAKHSGIKFQRLEINHGNKTHVNKIVNHTIIGKSLVSAKKNNMSIYV